MGIFIICAIYLLHILFLIYFILFAVKLKKRRADRVIESCRVDNPYSTLPIWGGDFCFWTLMVVLFCTDTVQPNEPHNILLMGVLTITMTIIIFFDTGKRIVLNEDKIIKYYFFIKKEISYTEITEIKENDFHLKVMSNRKRLFHLNIKYDSFDREFVQKLKSKMNNN